ncbi:MAG: glycosyltransferase family 4 protein [Panacibacter sp.]
MTYNKAIWKLRIERAGMFPFVLLGKLYGLMFPLKTKHSIFLFYPNADIGGAPKVNADITACIADVKPVIFFSKRPKNNQFRELFNIPGVRVIDLHKLIDKKIFHFINFFYRGVIASWIDATESPVVFGGESLFFYKVIPHIRKDIPCIELSHVGTWLPYNIGFIKRINQRIFSTLKLKEEVVQQYKENSIEPPLYNRLYFIDNAIDIPEYEPVVNEKLEVVFIGRGSPQKRADRTAAIAKKMHEANDPVHFSFVGDVENIINTTDYPYCRFYGNVKDNELMKRIYEQSDVLILTSAFEGLPLVVMTMMAYGKVILSTAVNGIPDYIKHMENGLLITETEDDKIIEQGVALLRLLINNPALTTTLGRNNKEIAMQKFGRDNFCKIYRGILVGDGKRKLTHKL